MTRNSVPSAEEIEAMKRSYKEFITSVPKVCSPTICGLANYKDSPDGGSDDCDSPPFGLNCNVMDNDLSWCQNISSSDDDDADEEDSDAETEMEIEVEEEDHENGVQKSAKSEPKDGQDKKKMRKQKKKKSKEFVFNWSIDQVAMLNPTEFSLEHQTNPAIYQEIDESMFESIRKESETYFSQSFILPSPELTNSVASTSAAIVGATSAINGTTSSNTNLFYNTDSGFHTQPMAGCSSNHFMGTSSSIGVSNCGLGANLYEMCNSSKYVNNSRTPIKSTDANSIETISMFDDASQMSVIEMVSIKTPVTGADGESVNTISMFDDVSNMSVIEMSSFKTPVTGAKSKKKKKLFKNVASNGSKKENVKPPKGGEDVHKNQVYNPITPIRKEDPCPTFDTPVNKNAFEAMTDLPSPFTPINPRNGDHNFNSNINCGQQQQQPLKWTPPNQSICRKNNNISISTPSLSTIEGSSDSSSEKIGFDVNHRITFSDITNKYGSPVGISPIVNKDNLRNVQHLEDIGFDGVQDKHLHYNLDKIVTTPIKRNNQKMANKVTPSKLVSSEKLKTSTPTLN